MSASYFRRGMNQQATFELFVRELPQQRRFLIACGIEAALEFLESLHFDDGSINALRQLEAFDEPFLQHLRDLRFSGDAWAVAEGEAVFASEPILRVTA